MAKSVKKRIFFESFTSWRYQGRCVVIHSRVCALGVLLCSSAAISAPSPTVPIPVSAQRSLIIAEPDAYLRRLVTMSGAGQFLVPLASGRDTQGATAPSDAGGVAPTDRVGANSAASAEPPQQAAGSPPQPAGAQKGDASVATTAGRGTERVRLLTDGATSPADADTDPDQLLALFQDGSSQASTTDEIDLVIGQKQVFSDLRTLEARLNDLQRPTANVLTRHSSQSDGLDINQVELAQDLYFSQGRNELRLGFQAINYEASYANHIQQYSGGFTGNTRLSQLLALSGEFWVDRIDNGPHHKTLAQYDVFVTLRPSDVIRIDIDTSRRPFDNLRSLQLGLTVQSYGGSIDYLPTDRLRLTGRAFGASYSDHNRRRSEEVEGIWRVRSQPTIELGVRGTNFHFTRQFDDGYFNPIDYWSGEAMVRLQSDLSEKLTAELAGSGGAEFADPGGTKPLVKGSLQLVYKLPHGWSLDGEASHFTSRASSSSGFARTTITLGLHYRF